MNQSYKFVNSRRTHRVMALRRISTASSCILLWVSDNQAAVYGVNKGTCRPEEGLAILSLILTRCDTLGIVLLAFWVPRELNRVSDYLSHLSVLIRSDVTGVFTADSADTLATAAAGVLDDSVISALARTTGVAADCVEQVMQSAGSRRRPEEFNSQDPHRTSISHRMRSSQSPPVSPVRDVHIHVLCPTRQAQLRQLPEPRDLFDSSSAGMCPPGPPLALLSENRYVWIASSKCSSGRTFTPYNGSYPSKSITCNGSQS